jgi:hypothetical protein
MIFKGRLITVAVLLAFASALYGAGRHYSFYIIRYVVEQSLVQKAPAGTNPADIQKDLNTLLSSFPDQETKTRRLLQISEYVEKTQFLTSGDLNGLLARKDRQDSRK